MASDKKRDEYYQRNKEKLCEKARIRYASNDEVRATRKLRAKKWRSENKNQRSETNKRWYALLSGEERLFRDARSRAGRKRAALDSSPSLDRLVPALGYVIGNIHVISNRANTLKNNASIKELECVIEYMKNGPN
jgi:hypothetical protein